MPTRGRRRQSSFDQPTDGVDAMPQQREGKITLRSHEVEDLPLEVACAKPVLPATMSSIGVRVDSGHNVAGILETLAKF
jgi:hypothetical protein